MHLNHTVIFESIKNITLKVIIYTLVVKYAFTIVKHYAILTTLGILSKSTRGKWTLDPWRCWGDSTVRVCIKYADE